jgi:glucose-1-phosphate thymidylyltransferase
MKGAILAGGLGTRLEPLTRVTSKSLLPIYDRPMIYYPIEALVTAGVNEIMLVAGGPYGGNYLPLLGDGHDLGVHHLEYTYQCAAGGIADALSLCETFAADEPLIVMLGDNITDGDLQPAIRDFRDGALIFLKRVDDPRRFGCPTFDPANPERIVRIEEKPLIPQSEFAVRGIYAYDRRVFEYIRQLRPSQAGELQITDVNNLYLADNRLRWVELNGFWEDAGTFDSLHRCADHWAKRRQDNVRPTKADERANPAGRLCLPRLRS